MLSLLRCGQQVSPPAQTKQSRQHEGVPAQVFVAVSHHCTQLFALQTLQHTHCIVHECVEGHDAQCMRLSTARMWDRMARPGRLSQRLIFRDCEIFPNLQTLETCATCVLPAALAANTRFAFNQQENCQHRQCFRGDGEVSTGIQNCCTSSCRCWLTVFGGRLLTLASCRCWSLRATCASSKRRGLVAMRPYWPAPAATVGCRAPPWPLGWPAALHRLQDCRPAHHSRCACTHASAELGVPQGGAAGPAASRAALADAASARMRAAELGSLARRLADAPLNALEARGNHR